MQLVFEVCPAGPAESAPALRKVFDGVGGVIGRGAVATGPCLTPVARFPVVTR